jgi:hypothetical protein
MPRVAHLIVEGGGPPADAWVREAERLGAAVERIAAETWRADLLYPRQQRSGPVAKATAGVLARRVIAWSELPRPPRLRHDAAEAILIGLWGVGHVGWLNEPPATILASVR